MLLESDLLLQDAIEEAQELLALLKTADLSDLQSDAQNVEWAAQDFFLQCRDLKRSILHTRAERAADAASAEHKAVVSEQRHYPHELI